MEINGVYYTEPELASKFRQMQQVIDHLYTENDLLVDKVIEGDKREREFKRLLLLACADIHFIAETFNTECGSMACSECPFTADECTQWVHEKEALDLIGEEP